ncbi:MAG: ATP-binding protein [bacterium]
MKKENQHKNSTLRQKAEELINEKHSNKGSNLTELDLQKLNHELEVHQIELEMQNDELNAAIISAQDAIALYDFAPSGYFTISRVGQIIKLNLKAANMLGKERSLLVGCIFGFYVSDDTKPIFRLFLDDVFKINSPASCEIKIVNKSEELIDVLLTGIVSDNKNQCLITVVDITKHKQVDDELLQREQQYRLLAESVSDVIWVQDIESTKFRYISPSIERQLGYTVEEISKHGLSTTIAASSLQGYKTIFEKRIQLYKNGLQDTFTDEIQHIHKNGNLIWVETNTRLSVNPLNGRLEANCVSRVITERKKAELEISLKNQELSKLNSEKDKLFSIIAHDLRSPFNIFLGLTQIMTEQLPTLTLPEIQKISFGMRDSAINLFKLLENLLDWSRIDQNLIPFEPKINKLQKTINESLEIILGQAENKSIKLELNIPDNIQVFADSNMLQTVFRNLLFNSIKFTKRGGCISLSAKNIGDEMIEISIKDFGIGMNPELMENLFRIDIRTNRKGTEGEPSTGLGLLICKEFIERHGGNLWVESEEGVGSTFYFTLPKAEF